MRKSGKYVSRKTVDIICRQMESHAHCGLHINNHEFTISARNSKNHPLTWEFNPLLCPDAVWCSDITYIWTFEGFVYLSHQCDGSVFEKNHFTGVGWDGGGIHVVEVCCKAMSGNVEKRWSSLRQVRYVSESIQKQPRYDSQLFKESISWDNAYIESFHMHFWREDGSSRFKILIMHMHAIDFWIHLKFIL